MRTFFYAERMGLAESFVGPLEICINQKSQIIKK